MASPPFPFPVTLPLAGLDRVRLWWLRALGPLARPLMRSRELRVALFGTASILASLALTVVAPIALLALGPILLGVPHAASDVRFLVMRPGLHRVARFWLLVVPGLVLATVFADGGWGMLAVAGAALAASGSRARRAVFAVGALALAALGASNPLAAALAMAHAHNLVAVLVWWSWRARVHGWHGLPLGAFVLGSCALLSGALDPVVAAFGGLGALVGGDALGTHLAALAPGFPGAWGPRLVLLFAFTQSVHYGVWLRLLPEEDRAQETPRTFAASFAAWRSDCGDPVVVVTFLLSLGVALVAFADVAQAREGYLRAVFAHGYLELAVVAWLVCEGRWGRACPAR